MPTAKPPSPPQKREEAERKAEAERLRAEQLAGYHARLAATAEPLVPESLRGYLRYPDGPTGNGGHDHWVTLGVPGRPTLRLLLWRVPTEEGDDSRGYCVSGWSLPAGGLGELPVAAALWAADAEIPF